MSPGSSFGSDSSAQFTRRAFVRGTAALLACGAAGSVFAQAPAPVSQYPRVDPISLPLDRPGVWTLNFAYTPIRILSVEMPNKSKKTVWYMIYQVYNRTDTPHQFIPEFELVTKDTPAAYMDEPQPWIVKKIREIEDPTGALNIQTSISISKTKIPVTKPDSIPRAVHGVAVWLDVVEKSPTTNAFSVYITGLSNGLARADTEGGEIISRKTLQLDFQRPTDNQRNGVNDIRPNDNNGLGAEKWVYRPASMRKKPVAPAPAGN